MAITQAQQDALVELYIAILDRAPDKAGLDFWADKLLNEANGDLTDIANRMWNSPGAKANYGASLTVEQTVAEIYQNVLNRAPDADGLDHWVSVWNAQGPGQTMLNMINNLKNNPSEDPAFLADKALFEAKVEAGTWYAFTYGGNDPDEAKELFRLIEEEGLSVEDAIAQLQIDPAETYVLTANQDNITAGSGDDLFTATQATLQTGDDLNGGAGDDTLSISIQGSNDFFAAPTLNGIETIRVNAPNFNGEAIEIDLSNADGYNTLESFQTTGHGEDAYVQFHDIQNINGTDIRIIDTDLEHYYSYDSNASLSLGGDDDIVDLYLSEVDGSYVEFYTEGGWDSHVDQINITSATRTGQPNDTTFNYLVDLWAGQYLNTVIIDGDADLEVEDYLDVNVNLVDAGALEADLTLDLYAQGLNWIVGGTGNDTFWITDTQDGLTVIGAQGDDNIDVGGYGEDGHGNYDLGTGNDDLRVGVHSESYWSGEGEDFADETYTYLLAGHQTVDAGEGNDRVQLNVIGLQEIALGDGHDTLDINGYVDDLFTLPAYDGVTSVDAGAGNDFVTINGFAATGEGEDWQQPAHDTDDFGVKLVNGEITTLGGFEVGDYGEDIASIGDYDIKLGDGDDILHMWVDGAPTIDAGAGDDFAIVRLENDNNVVFDGGDGNDTLVIQGDGVHTITMGDGDDVALIDGARVGSGNIDNTIDDEYTVFDGGAGDDFLRVEGDHYLDVTMGEGDDTVSLKAEHLTGDDIIRGDAEGESNVGNDTLILTNEKGVGDGDTDASLVLVGRSETGGVTGIENFDLRNQNIQLVLTEELFDTANGNDITVITRHANGAELLELTINGVLAPNQLSQGMSRAEYNLVKANFEAGVYDQGPLGSDFEQWLFTKNGVNTIDGVNTDLSTPDDSDQAIRGVDESDLNPSTVPADDEVYFWLEPEGQMVVDITDVSLHSATGRTFTLDGGNIKDVVIADDDSINGRAILRFDDGSANNSIEDTLIVKDGATITAADLRNVVGLENIVLQSDSNNAVTWSIELTDRVIDQTTGSATLYIKVDPNVPAGSRLNITLDDSVHDATNDVVIEGNANVEIYVNGQPATSEDYNTGLNSIHVITSLLFTANADHLQGADDFDDNFYAQSLSHIQAADFADGGGSDYGDDVDTLYVGFAPNNPNQDLKDQFNDAFIQDIERLIFTQNDFTGPTGSAVRMEGLGTNWDFLNNVATVETGIGNDELEEMEGENDEGGVIHYILNAGDDYFHGDYWGEDYWVDAGAGNDTVDLWDTTGDATVYGGDGNDDIFTGEGDDYVYGGNGDDYIVTGEGNDFIDGGAGNDLIYAGEGNDSVIGGAGNDSISGGDGNDTIYGDGTALEGGVIGGAGTGDDTIYGGDGNDVIHAGGGNNWVDAGDGDNIVTAGAGDDTITTYGGADIVVSGAGNDVINVGSGNDSVWAGAGNDVISFAHMGALDLVDGGTGIDTVQVANADVMTDANFEQNSNVEYLVLTGAGVQVTGESNFEDAGYHSVSTTAGGDKILDFTGVSNAVKSISEIVEGEEVSINGAPLGSTGLTITIGDVEGAAPNDGNNQIYGSVGADTITGGDGDDAIRGNAGADVINLGRGGSDMVVYARGDDGALTGQETGFDIINGFESGDDTVRVMENLFAALNGADAEVNNFNLELAGSTTGLAVYTNTGLTDADLTSFDTMLVYLNNFLGTADAADSALFSVQGTNNTALYYYVENDGVDNTISAGELRILGVFNDAHLVETDFNLA
ncbi:MAG: DUF4214 domain-containing protein [Porticoccaceae bacterium]